MIQVLLNLLKNAKDVLIERKVAGPKVVMRIESGSKQEIICYVEDNAGGIPDKVIDHIFEPYFSTKDEKNGTGLGLYMSKAIVEDHLDGTLLASNREKGACFAITIPYKDPPEDA